MTSLFWVPFWSRGSIWEASYQDCLIKNNSFNPKVQVHFYLSWSHPQPTTNYDLTEAKEIGRGVEGIHPSSLLFFCLANFPCLHSELCCALLIWFCFFGFPSTNFFVINFTHLPHDTKTRCPKPLFVPSPYQLFCGNKWPKVDPGIHAEISLP